MMNKKLIIFNIFLWSASSLVGFNFGQKNTEIFSKGLSRVPQNEKIAHTFEGIPCPSQQTYDRLKSQYNISSDPPKFSDSDPSDLCSKKSNKAILAKSLILLESLKIDNLPTNWRWGAKTALENPGKYFSDSTPRVFYDFTRKTAVAYNRGSNDNIALCPIFFTRNDLLSNALTLVHEARHSNRLDPAHVECRQGDLTARKGGCDELFRIDERQGSYAFANVSYTFGISEHSGLSEEKKSYLKSKVLWYLANRFNQVPAILASHTDLVYILSDKGELHLLHPFFKKLVRSPKQYPGIPKSIFYTRRGELLAFYENQNPWKYSPILKTNPTEFFKSNLKDAYDVKFMNYLSYSSGNSRDWYFLTEDNGIHLIQMNPDKGENEVLRSSYQPFRNQRLQTLFTANPECSEIPNV